MRQDIRIFLVGASRSLKVIAILALALALCVGIVFGIYGLGLLVGLNGDIALVIGMGFMFLLLVVCAFGMAAVDDHHRRL